MTTTAEEFLTRYNKWETGRAALSEAEGSGDYPSSSSWEDSDDEGVELARIAAHILTQPHQVWVMAVTETGMLGVKTVNVTVHPTEEACWESLRENYDPEGEADDQPPVAIVGFLENEQGLTIQIDVHTI